MQTHSPATTKLSSFISDPQSLRYPSLHESDSLSLLLSVSGDRSFQSKCRCCGSHRKVSPGSLFFICLPHVEPHEDATVGDLTVFLLSSLEPVVQRANIFELGETLASFNLK